MLVGSAVAWLGARREREAQASATDASADKLRTEAANDAFALLRAGYDTRIALLEQRVTEMAAALLEKDRQIAELQRHIADRDAQLERMRIDYEETLRRLTARHAEEIKQLTARIESLE